jgi:hypothetical protein
LPRRDSLTSGVSPTASSIESLISTPVPEAVSIARPRYSLPAG